nr:PREDICTED: xylosyltransferase oxt [Bemisia tabaci]
MATNRPLDIRWIRRYKAFYIAGVIIFCIQILLAYFFLASHDESRKNDRDFQSGKGRWNLEVADDKRRKEFRGDRENVLGVDDEDNPANSNSIISELTRNKVLPDKLEDRRIDNKVPQISKLSNVSHLRLEELDFVPLCDITGKEAISAIHRAKTQYCKQEISNISCLIAEGLLYPKKLPHLCAISETGKSLGCFQDGKSKRLLSSYYVSLKFNNSPSNCVNLCLQSGFSYAGVQLSTECFCGNEKPPSSFQLPDSSCNMKCPADTHQMCGGYLTSNIYQTGIAKFSARSVKDSFEEREHDSSPLRIAFLLTLNGRAVRQVHRLIKTLFHRNHFFFIHVDARQDYLFRELLALELHLPNVRLSRRRHATIWGGASLLTMLLESMSELVNSAWDWDFVINLSESDFPVKTNAQLVSFLSANRNVNFVKSHGREVQRFIQKQGLDKTFVECEAHMWRVGDRVLPTGIVMDGGSDWIALSRSFVNYIAASEQDELIKGLIVLFKYTLLPAESFFHTALRNSIFCDSYVDNNLHVTNWKRRLGCKCQYKHVVDWCGCSPNNFRPEDWSRIQGTEEKNIFFARKFEPIVSQTVISQVEEWLYGPYPQGIPNLLSYWQSTYHYADLSPQTNDALVTIATSLARIASKQLSNPLCAAIPVKLLQIHTYLHNDQYEGSLILYEVLYKSSAINSSQLETMIKPKNFFKKLTSSGPISRLKVLSISSDYDQKEQMSRDFMQVIGPFSEPHAIYQWISGKDHVNLTFLWLDPTNTLAEASYVYMDESASISFTKPVLKTPLLPGVWQVKVVLNSQIVAQTEFFVTPLEFVGGQIISQQQTSFLHNGPSQSYKVKHEDWKHILGDKDSDSANTLDRKAVINSRRFGLDLRQWIDSLVTRFYSVIKSCSVNLLNVSNCEPKEICSATLWSTFAVDPKSQITSINKTSGGLNRW